MHLTRVGVIRGGPSAEYGVSLNTGNAVLRALQKHHEDKYYPVDVCIDRQGLWHLGGIAIRPEHLVHKVDIVFNALHGAYGEDGTIQSFLETHSIPFTGSNSLGSAVGMSKLLTKKVFTDSGIKTPYWKEISSMAVNENVDTVARQIFSSFLLPAIVKPASSGSSVGISVIRSFEDIKSALLQAAPHGHSIVLEEFIPGIEATCGVIQGFRGEELYALPPIEIRHSRSFFDHEAKYAGESEEIVPATFSEKLKNSLEVLATSIHRMLGLRHYSRSDFIIHPRRGIYALEVNTLPGLTEESLIPKALKAVGSDLPEFVDHLIQLAMAGRM